MKCFECLKPRTDSPDIPKTQSAPLSAAAETASPGAKQTAVGVERSGGGPAPRRQPKYAYFEEVLKSEKAMEVLRQYMTGIQQDHLIDFLTDVERFRSQRDKVARQRQAQEVFNTYLRVLADREVTLDAPVRGRITARLEQAPPDLFDEADQVVTEDIRRDVFPRFLKTPLFERLAGLA